MITSPAVRPEVMGLMVDEQGSPLPTIPLVDIVRDLANNDYLEHYRVPQNPTQDQMDLHFMQLGEFLQSKGPLRRAAGLYGLCHHAVNGKSSELRARARILLARNLSASDLTPQLSLSVAKRHIAAQAIQAQLVEHQGARRLSELSGREDFADYRRLGEMFEYYASLGPEGARGGLAVGDTVLDLEQIQRYAIHMKSRDRTSIGSAESEHERKINTLNQEVKNAIVDNRIFQVNRSTYNARQQSVHMSQVDQVSDQLRAEMLTKVTPTLTGGDAFRRLQSWISNNLDPVDSTGQVIQSSSVVKDYRKSRNAALLAIDKHLNGSAVLAGVSETLPLVWTYAVAQSDPIKRTLLLQVMVERLAEIEKERNCIFGQRAIMLQVPLGITINAKKVFQFEDIKQDLEKIAYKLMEDANVEGEHQLKLFRDHQGSTGNAQLNEVLTPYYRQRMKMERFVRVELLLGLGADLFKTDLKNWMLGIESFLT